jgi:DUF1009 family protein
MSSGAGDGDRSGRIAIIAGNGQLPVTVAETLEKQGRNPFIFAIEGEADPALHRFEHETIYTAHIGRLLSTLKKVKPTEVVMIGGVRSRPNLLRIIPDRTTLRLLGRMLPKLRQGDDSLLRSVVEIIESEGVRVRGVHELVPELLAAKGLIAGPAPRKSDLESMQTGIAGAKALGLLDAGQACVAVGKRIVALEGAEGTDLMLERIAGLRNTGRLAKRPGGVLVKLAKPIQDIRVDLPTVGVSTIENAARAGLKGVAVHAGSSLIADYPDTCAKADELGLFLMGVDPEECPQQSSSEE